MLIRLTPGGGKPVWVNKNLIEIVYACTDKVSAVRLHSGAVEFAAETPEQIARLCSPLVRVGPDGALIPVEGA